MSAEQTFEGTAVDGVAVHRDVVHVQVDGYRPLALDLYVPTSGARALAVYLHGGGWRRGSRRNGPGPLTPTSGRLFVRAARQGLAVASVDYRLSGEATFPAQCHDVDAACTFLHEHGDRFGVADVPMVIWGVSAGGTLAALRALDANATPPMAAAALWYAVTDLGSMPNAAGPANEPTREGMWLGAPPATVPDIAGQASPLAQVHTGAPPFLLIHGESDDLVPTQQSRQMHDALIAAGASSTIELLPGWNHMLAGMPDAQVETHVDRTVAFLLDGASKPR